MTLTPKEKEQELYDKVEQELYFSYGRGYSYEVKAVVKITIQEIMNWERMTFGTDTPAYTYWQEVLTQLEKL